MLTEKHTRHFDEIEKYYKPKIIDGVPDFQALGWENMKAHILRFDILANNVDLNNKKLLDVGCGLGSFFEYLKRNKIEASYTGVDILPEMIAYAKKKHNEGVFSCLDIFDGKTKFPGDFDVVYASGIFNLDLGNNEEFVAKALERFFDLAKEIISFNLLHRDSPDKEDNYFYTNPDFICGLLKKYKGRFYEVEYYHSYQKNDFTVIIRR